MIRLQLNILKNNIVSYNKLQGKAHNIIESYYKREREEMVKTSVQT